MMRKASTHPRFSGESTDAQRGRQADQGRRKRRRLHKEARSWQKVGLDQTELAGERKEHQENQVPAGVDCVDPPLSEPHFLYTAMRNSHLSFRVAVRKIMYENYLAHGKYIYVSNFK